MTTTQPVRGDSAMAVSVSIGPTVVGRVAMNVYGFATAADANAAGFNAEAGPAMPIYIVSDAEIADGTFTLEGDPLANPVYIAPAGMVSTGQNPIPVYPVNP